VYRAGQPEVLLGSFSCQSDGIRTSIFAECLLSEHKPVSLPTSFCVSVWEIETVTGKSDSVLAFFVGLVNRSTLGFWKVRVAIIICIESVGISRRQHNLLRLALPLGTGVVLAMGDGQDQR